jgi:bifunctional UDP-N-acetylglucosamine pyrophosphorylase / glucosamine-1-phosphate N-acetyltransferase
VELAQVDALLRDRKTRELMMSGVTIFRPETVQIDPDVQVGADTVIEPCVTLVGKTRIGQDCRIGAFTVITNCELAGNVTVKQSCVFEDSKVAEGAILGPFARLRPESEIGPGAHVGNFVEVKKSKLGRGSKANHLTYLGDATIGENVNIGCGTITVNYDPLRLEGDSKQRTIVEDEAFVGSGSNLIAPIRIGRNAFIAAGSTITDEVPEDALAIGRGRQANKPGWVRERKAKRKQNNQQASIPAKK